MKSSATVQQMQPLASSIRSSSRQSATASLQHFAIDAEVAEFIDDEGSATAIGMGQQMAEEGGPSGLEKPVMTVTGILSLMLSHPLSVRMLIRTLFHSQGKMGQRR